ncbi:hypothetical protein N1851_000285 [Merluccius polli]|uniref:CCHC-type domain-containing protein n=1 Tax=Merluccius polli TaxID=89951 RepID=A0AA47ND96_MERPO|nr:hypothetical protein N1851_000285 [Merluccius polli]
MSQEPLDLQALRGRMEQLQAENDHLRRDRDAAQAGSSSSGLLVDSAAPERVVYLPRERRCPVFRGSHGIGIDEWVEEVKTTSLQPRLDGSPDSSTSSQLAALTALVHKQQEQLNQITQTLAAMQKLPASQHSRPNIICRRCQRPGHYASDCENERSRPRPSSTVSAPQVVIKLAGVNVKCILDTGSMVSTISEKFFKQNFQGKLKSCHWLELRAANGLEIPYLGYLEPDVEVLGCIIPRRGVLVVKDPPERVTPPEVPGILGMNIIKACYQGLIRQCGPQSFDLSAVVEPSGPWLPAFQFCQQAEVQPSPSSPCLATLRSRRRVRIPGGSTKIVAATCSAFDTSSSILVEPLSSGYDLPAGLLVSSALVQVVRGTAYIPVVNVGVSAVNLRPRCPIGRLSSAEVPPLPPLASDGFMIYWCRLQPAMQPAWR